MAIGGSGEDGRSMARQVIDTLYRTIRRVRITWRLLGFVLTLVLVGLMMIGGQRFIMQQQLDYLQYLEAERLPADRLVQQAAFEIASSQVALSQYLVGKADPEAVHAHISNAKRDLTAAQLITHDEHRGQQLRDLFQAVDRYASHVEQLRYAAMAGDQEQVTHHSQEAQRLSEVLRAEAQGIVQESAEQAQTDMQQAVRALQRTTLVGSVGVLLIFVALTGAAYLIARSVIRPIREIQEAMQRLERGTRDEWEPPLAEAARASDELGDLARSFHQMARTIHEARVAQEAWSRQLEDQVRLRTQELHQLVDQQEQLLATIRAMSVPVIPVLERIIVLPLVGVVDSQRAGQVVEGLLQGIEAHQARIALVDITGVPVVDTHVAGTLLHAARAARLLGCQMVLVGIRPEVAHTLVNLGVDLGGLATYADLQSGVEYALRMTSTGR